MASSPPPKKKKKKSYNVKPTAKQEAYFEKVSNNVENKPKGTLAREAGFAPKMADKIAVIESGKGYIQLKDTFLTKIKKIKNQALKEMEKKAGSAKFGALSTTVKDFTQLEQLLEGKPTERKQIFGIAAIQKMPEKELKTGIQDFLDV